MTAEIEKTTLEEKDFSDILKSILRTCEDKKSFFKVLRGEKCQSKNRANLFQQFIVLSTAENCAVFTKARLSMYQVQNLKRLIAEFKK